MKKLLVAIILLGSCNLVAQDTLKLGRLDCERIFLEQNLSLLAEKLEVPKAEAQVLQAKLWPNPTFTFDQVNFWATRGQTGGEMTAAPLFGKWGKNQQFAAEVEQLILTAGKRKKLMAVEQVSVEKSKEYFEELLRNLKLELRSQLTELQFLQYNKSIYQEQIKSIQKLTSVYQKQVQEGNIPRGEYVRLKALELGFSKNINDLNQDINDVQKELKVLMRLPANSFVVLNEEGFERNVAALESTPLTFLISNAQDARPDLKLAALEESYFNRLYTYEKAQKVPNLNFKSSYDRNGSTMLNFVGFGVSMDLPFFNKNQGNIRQAQIGVKQAKILFEQKEQTIENEIVLAYQNLKTSTLFLKSIEEGYGQTLDELLQAYTKNFSNRNISMLEYIDYVDAYLENKKIILEATKNVNEKAEELNYTVGKDVI